MLDVCLVNVFVDFLPFPGTVVGLAVGSWIRRPRRGAAVLDELQYLQYSNSTVPPGQPGQEPIQGTFGHVGLSWLAGWHCRIGNVDNTGGGPTQLHPFGGVVFSGGYSIIIAAIVHSA